MNIKQFAFSPNFLGKNSIPYSNQSSHFHVTDYDISKKYSPEEDEFVPQFNAKDNIFRDEELYDAEYDRVSQGYVSYSNDDVPLFTQPKNYLDIDYRNTYNLDRESDSYLDTDVIEYNHGYTVCLPLDTQPDELDRKLNEFLINDKRIEIFNNLKRKKGEPTVDILAICNAAVLKSDSFEDEVNMGMITKGFMLLHRKQKPMTLSQVVNALNASKLKDAHGNEYYSHKVANFAAEFPEHYKLVITSDKNGKEIFDTESAKVFNEFNDYYEDPKLAGEILNACRIKKNDGYKILNSDLLFAARYLQNIEAISSSDIPDVVNSLKSCNANTKRVYVSKQKFHYLISHNNKTAIELLNKFNKKA